MQENDERDRKETKTAEPSLTLKSPPNQNPRKEQTADPNQEIAKWTKVVGNWTRGLVFVGFATLAVLGAQLFAFIQSERAAVSFARIDTNGKPTSGKNWSILLRFSNRGKSTAAIREVSIAFQIGNTLNSTPLYNRSYEQALGDIPAGGDSVLSIHPITEITGDDVSEIEKGNKKFFLYGFVRYSDDYWWISPEKLLAFCSFYDPTGVPGISEFLTCHEKAYTYAR